ncbi:hypothetical protein CC80DRAFT_519784 [Byssothecium circinans]|uniref:FAR-17a/AIG1-like protein n=1 Tax=Byssothecium circinans TaxID=147558 RepID=A0A6A5T8A2_9PLEO|nr:hypothetical protein CC80DRAFT_430469 [Byssothecium circinans]KAF1950860.1 hypothetical protein CC80DRAFT_519784 [Byssothecium circinans]
MVIFNRSAPRAEFDPTYRFTTSWILPTSVLFFIRAALSIYAFTTLFFILAWHGTHNNLLEARQSFSYFTVLTYWGLAFYYGFAALHTGSYWRTGTPLLARWPKFLQVSHSLFYSTIVIYPFIVTVVFWALLAPENGFPSIFATWSNTSQHAMNSAYALFEIIIPRTEPLPFLHLIAVIIILAMYLGLAYVTHITQGFYTYDFLNLQTNSSGKVAAYIVGILAAAVIIFLIVRYLIMLRVWVTEKKMGKMGKFSARRPGRVRMDEEEGKYPMYTVTAR